MTYLWLDDRRPAPPGWTLAKTVAEAKALLEDGDVEMASLDHDLGACDACNAEMCKRTGIEDPVEAWLHWSGNAQMPNCEHFETGYDLVCWMEETGIKPRQKPIIHSFNVVGAHRMGQAIDKLY